MRGRQYNLDGYVWQGDVRPLGVVDEVMYPNTDAFMRFEYPSKLHTDVQARAADVARRFLNAVGFDHGLFNMEFFHDEATGKITVIEFNPRMASQFSDLYLRVDGIDLHEIAFALAHGIDPATLARKAPTAGATASFVYRSFDPKATVPFPSFVQKAAFRKAFPMPCCLNTPKTPKNCTGISNGCEVTAMALSIWVAKTPAIFAIAANKPAHCWAGQRPTLKTRLELFSAKQVSSST